ncbi:unnamed protein product [Ectocarpus sp. 12 AP-2014]
MTPLPHSSTSSFVRQTKMSRRMPQQFDWSRSFVRIISHVGCLQVCLRGVPTDCVQNVTFACNRLHFHFVLPPTNQPATMPPPSLHPLTYHPAAKHTHNNASSTCGTSTRLPLFYSPKPEHISLQSNIPLRFSHTLSGEAYTKPRSRPLSVDYTQQLAMPHPT